MKEELLKDEIERLKLQIEDQSNQLLEIESGSEIHDYATKSLERTVNAYCKAVETQNSIEEKKRLDTREWVKLLGGFAINGLMILGGIAAMKQIGIMEAIDEANGNISSLAIRNQKNLVKRVIENWMSGKTVKV